MLPVGHHLFIAGALSAAIPPEGWLPPLIVSRQGIINLAP